MQNTTEKTILILGGTGKVGALLRRAWAQAPPENTRLIWQSRTPCADMVPFRPGDSADIFRKVDAVLSLWGGVSDLPANTSLALESQRIAAACGADRVLHFSSIAAYHPLDVPLRETNRLGDANPYGAAKANMERALAGVDGPRSCCLRVGSVAGAESLAAAMARDEQIVLDRFASGLSALRSYIAPSDLAATLVQLCQLPPDALPPALNIGAPRALRMADLLSAADRGYNWRDAPDGAREEAVLNTDLLQSLAPLPQHSADAVHIIADLDRLKAAT